MGKHADKYRNAVKAAQAQAHKALTRPRGKRGFAMLANGHASPTNLNNQANDGAAEGSVLVIGLAASL